MQQYHRLITTSAALVVLVLGMHLLLIQGVTELHWATLAGFLLALFGEHLFKNLFAPKLSALALLVLQITLVFISIYRVHRGGPLDTVFLSLTCFFLMVASVVFLRANARSLSGPQKGLLFFAGLVSAFSVSWIDTYWLLLLAFTTVFLCPQKKTLNGLLLYLGGLFICTFLTPYRYSEYFLTRFLGNDAKFEIIHLSSSYGELHFIARTERKAPEIVFDIAKQFSFKKSDYYFHNSRLRQNISAKYYTAAADFAASTIKPAKHCLIISSEVGQIAQGLISVCKRIDIASVDPAFKILQKAYWAQGSHQFLEKINWVRRESFPALRDGHYDVIFGDCDDIEFHDLAESNKFVFYCSRFKDLKSPHKGPKRVTYSSAFGDSLSIPQTLMSENGKNDFYKEVAPHAFTQ
ncbi:MAG: hypothetical protein OM95_09510 [Bdellovibrio sp. ArHS]|uniref:hypothetical protein n=1 Tax=Bdellovibrio sp. ArHS TaxID=1569284 RepID=UPI000583F19D|nr:hypothetical protein [Bdellovibrio sp. ArHS]KHD88366.1 MAG: hypothetical protein OM95_09510 [Bdellovibrio sp. ArHS]